MIGTTPSIDSYMPLNTTGGAAKEKPDVSKEAFMQLLVAQIKNQNPLNPADGVQFLTQLAQFSELEQLVNMNSELKTIRETVTTPDPAATGESTKS